MIFHAFCDKIRTFLNKTGGKENVYVREIYVFFCDFQVSIFNSFVKMFRILSLVLHFVCSEEP